MPMSICLLLALSLATVGPTEDENPYDRQVRQNVEAMHSDDATVRAGAAEALGFLRAYPARNQLVEALTDPSVEVRRQAALATAWCGGRAAVEPLFTTLEDDDWCVRRAASVALENLTGMTFPFEANAPANERAEQVARWRDWWARVPADQPPAEVLAMLRGPTNLARGAAITASTTYKGPPEVLLDGRIGPDYWQTKGVAPPQWCSIDLGRVIEIDTVRIHQYGAAFVMTGFELATSVDGREFTSVERREHPGTTPVLLEVRFPARKTRHVRITSFGSVNPTYPSTFHEIEIRRGEKSVVERPDESASWRQERAARALGALGGEGAVEALLDVLGETPPGGREGTRTSRAAIRSLGRLGGEKSLDALIALLDEPFWARFAAEALGDVGDRRAIVPLTQAYLRYAKLLSGGNPPDVPRDDRMGFPSEDRMLETPYSILQALCRLPWNDPDDLAALEPLAPRLTANLPGDHDAMFLYEPEVAHRLTAYLLERTGRRREACEHVFALLGQPPRGEKPSDAHTWSTFRPDRIACWLPTVCTDREDLPRLIALLDHPDGWVRLNAAKTLAWLGDERAVEPIERRLREAKNEAAFGYSGTFKFEEYDDPAPRWREGLVRALGLLKAHGATELLVDVLNDQGSVLEVRMAAAEALRDLGNERALDALEQAAVSHDFLSVRNRAHDAVRLAGRRLDSSVSPVARDRSEQREPVAGNGANLPDALVFIQGSNSIPNTIGTVEQADRWRQTYVVTDSGPAYRPGRNLRVLRPVRPDGKVFALTQFEDGYVAEPEVAFDGSHVVFCRRGQDDPWWHLWRIDVDGTALEQLTFGPYHAVGPVYLPDGRIAYASSRNGIRDEYHGYPCTALWVMNADGSARKPIATNIGRDNDPAMLPDGRIVFSRLEVFYSRNKTELTLHAVRPDGTGDTVLYGPERRKFWRALDHGPRSPADGQEAPLTHRVLRMTQAQPMPDGRHIVVVTQGGLTLISSRRDTEHIITPDNHERSYTTPAPLADGTILCASTLKTPDRAKVDLGLYRFNPVDASLELIYNDPTLADFEPKPIFTGRSATQLPRQRRDATEPNAYSGRFLCGSIYHTQEEAVRERGRLVRLIEGVPVVGRHSTHNNRYEVWQNHGGTLARVLGTLPVDTDGSFHVEVPADRLLHFQVLDSDRRVVGNQITWIYARPGEQKSCIGCHESRHETNAPTRPVASYHRPIDLLPHGDEFTYRAKAWFKGSLPDDIERRTRTVRAVNLLAR